MTRKRTIFPLSDDFWSRVEVRGDCWVWTGRIKDGYGGYGRNYLAHRLVWQEKFGPIPDGLFVLHNCPTGDNRACCNPDHLFLGTKTDNARDRDEKGRVARGESHGKVKLTENDVIAIRARKRCGERAASLAIEYGVTEGTIRNITGRHTWKHIP
jgi:hypothetical protein